MARPASKELTARELELMHVFWAAGESTAGEARDELAKKGIDRAYVTVANLVRLLVDKRYLRAVNDERPFRYRPLRTLDDVSRNLIRDLTSRLFGGSREMLLTQLLSGQQRLTSKERELLQRILKEQDNG